MTDLEKLRQWLESYPQWEPGRLHVDYTDAAPVNAGLFPQGLEELSRTQDVLGNVTARCRYRFALYRVVTQPVDEGQNARWLMAFQNWVQAQSIAALAPRFGSEPATERIRAEKGKLLKASQAGTLTYVVTLTADFTKKYEVN